MKLSDWLFAPGGKVLGGVVLGVLLDDGAIIFFELWGELKEAFDEKNNGLRFLRFYFFNHKRAVKTGCAQYRKGYV